MLSKADNELLTRVGPGTPMGDLLRQYWIPVLFSAELPEPDGRPLRVRLLGEELVAFRDTQGRIGLLGEHCSHRRTSLYFGRNEECGLRCMYHGWKFDVAGRCVDMPSEPPESSFKDKIRHPAYPCQERAGVVWTYMGPRAAPPALPDLEWLTVPDDQRLLWKALRDCNWVQALEGDIDTAHLYFLHSRLEKDGDAGFGSRGTGTYHPDRHPHLELVPTTYGMMYGARREESAEQYYWRITQFLFPFFTLFPPGGFSGVPGHIWVPLDDEHTLVWSLLWNPVQPLTEADRSRFGPHSSGGYLPATSDPLSQWRLAASRSNDYGLDDEAQRTLRFSGIPSVYLQDQAATETMGSIVDRSEEHLGSTDAMIIQVRRRLLDAARALRERGVTPPNVDDPGLYGVRSASLVLPKTADWVEASKDFVKAFSGLAVASA